MDAAHPGETCAEYAVPLSMLAGRA
jgi:hypothetical protein